MYRPISQSREVESKGRIRPLPRARKAPLETEGPLHASLSYKYFETLSKPRSTIFAQRPLSAAATEETVAINPIDAPEVVRAATPFSFTTCEKEFRTSRPTTSSLRLPQIETTWASGVYQDDAQTFPNSELSQTADPDLASFGVSTRRSVARSSVVAQPQQMPPRPTTATSDKLVCFVGDRPLSYYSSPLRRGPGRLRSAGALALQLRTTQSLAQDVSPESLLTHAEIAKEQERVLGSHDTQHKLNRLLRCSSAARPPTPAL